VSATMTPPGAVCACTAALKCAGYRMRITRTYSFSNSRWYSFGAAVRASATGARDCMLASSMWLAPPAQNVKVKSISIRIRMVSFDSGQVGRVRLREPPTRDERDQQAEAANDPRGVRKPRRRGRRRHRERELCRDHGAA